MYVTVNDYNGFYPYTSALKHNLYEFEEES